MAISHRTGRRNARRLIAAAFAALLVLATTSPVAATEAGGSAPEDVTTPEIRPKFWRVQSNGSSIVNSTVVRSDIWVRVQFVDENGSNIQITDLNGFDAESLTVTNGTVVSNTKHPNGYAWIYEVRADADAETMTVSMVADEVTDDDGTGNTAGSLAFTVEDPFKPVLSTTATQPVLGGSFRAAVAFNYDVTSSASHDQVAAFDPLDDIKLSHGRIVEGDTPDSRNYVMIVGNYGDYVGWISASIPEDRISIDGRSAEWNHASDVLRVFVGAPFTVEGASSVDYWHESTDAVGTYTASEGAGTVTWSLSGADSDDFSISSSGELSFVSARDYDSPTDADTDNVYEVTINAASDDHSHADDLGAGFTATKNVTVAIDKAPEISSVAITSDPGDDDTYAIGDTIEVTATFDEPVTVAESDSASMHFGLNIDVGSSESYTQPFARYDRKAGDSGLVFAYTVASSLAKTDTDGIAISSTSLTLRDGTVRDRTNHDASLSFDSIAADADHKVDAVAPTVSGVAIASEPDTEGSDTYAKGETVSFTVTFSEPMAVTGEPELSLNVGGVARAASFGSLTDSKNQANFSYTVIAGDDDDNGISVDADSLQLNGGTITDVAGNPASLSHAELGDDASHKVFGAVAHVDAIGFSKDPDVEFEFGRGDVLDVYVWFAESGSREGVTVTGSPQLALDIGGTERLADYRSGDSRRQTFRYTFAPGDSGDIAVPANAIRLNGGTIHDSDDNVPALLEHAAITTSLTSEAPLASVTKVQFDRRGLEGTSEPETGPYLKDDLIIVTVWFDYPVSVTGEPQLALDIGGTERLADFSRVVEGRILLFAYSVVPGDVDDDGVSVPANAIRLNDGTITDTGVAAELTHDELLSTDNVSAPLASVDAVGVSNPDTGSTYVKGEYILAYVDYSEDVTVTGTPQLAIDIGGTERLASYVGNEDDEVLFFGYTITTGDIDTDGLSIPADALSLNGGTITDKADDVPALLTHDAYSGGSGQLVSAPYATISSISFSDSDEHGPGDDDSYGNGDEIRVEVTFSEQVTVIANPDITDPDVPGIDIVIGTTTRTATYDSTSGNTLYFTYTVVVGDVDTDGISLSANALSLNDYFIQDSAEVAAKLAHSAVSDNAGHQVSAPGGL